MDGDLLHASFDGANGATSFTGADGVIWTPTNPGAQLTTSTPKYGSACARLGTGGVGFVTDQPVDLGSGDFTIEMWVRPRVGPSIPLTPVFTTFEPGNSTGVALYAGNNGTTNGFNWWIPGVGSGFFSGGGGSTAVDVWVHVALVRIGTSLYAHVNGTRIGPLSTSFSSTLTPRTVYIGRLMHNATDTGATGAVDVDDLRISNFARYTASFTPSGPNSYTPPTPPAPVDLEADGVVEATGAAQIVAGVELAGAGLAMTSGSAGLHVNVQLAASGSAQVTATGQLLLNIGLSAEGLVDALGAANLALSKELAASGAAQASGTATPIVEGSIELTGAGYVEASGDATLSLVVNLSAEALAQAQGAAALAIGAPLSAAGVIDATGGAELAKTVEMAGAGMAQATGGASLWLSIPLSAEALAQASGSAALSLQILMDAPGVVQATGSGALLLDVQLVADGQAISSGQGSLQVFAGIAGAMGMLVKPKPRDWNVTRPVRGWHARPPSRSWRIRPSARYWNLQEGAT